MKTLWNALAVLAIANLIAMVGLLAWLRTSGRLNVDRARDVRALFSTTIAADLAAAEAAQKSEQAAKAQEEEAAKAARVPLTASEALAARAQATELDRERMERLRREVQDLQASLARERAALSSDRASLETDRRAFEAEQARIAATTGTEQFEKSLGVIAGLKPAAARTVLTQIMRGAGMIPTDLAQEPAEPAPGVMPGKTDAGMRLAVEYLNAMDDRARGKIMAEFAKDDPGAAAELVELLRMRGRVASGGGVQPQAP